LVPSVNSTRQENPDQQCSLSSWKDKAKIDTITAYCKNSDIPLRGVCPRGQIAVNFSPLKTIDLSAFKLKYIIFRFN